GNGGAEAKYVGGAPDATLLVANVASGASDDIADSDILTGVRFIFDRADNMPGGPWPTVVNLSIAGDFGPHDGWTALERALAAMVGPDHPGRSILVAAGNSGALYYGDDPEQILGIHSEVRVTEGAPGRVSLLSAGRLGEAPLSGGVFVWITFRLGD